MTLSDALRTAHRVIGEKRLLGTDFRFAADHPYKNQIPALICQQIFEFTRLTGTISRVKGIQEFMPSHPQFPPPGNSSAILTSSPGHRSQCFFHHSTEFIQYQVSSKCSENGLGISVAKQGIPSQFALHVSAILAKNTRDNEHRCQNNGNYLCIQLHQRIHQQKVVAWHQHESEKRFLRHPHRKCVRDSHLLESKGQSHIPVRYIILPRIWNSSLYRIPSPGHASQVSIPSFDKGLQ